MSKKTKKGLRPVQQHFPPSAPHNKAHSEKAETTFESFVHTRRIKWEHLLTINKHMWTTKQNRSNLLCWTSL